MNLRSDKKGASNAFEEETLANQQQPEQASLKVNLSKAVKR
jgi:hypothetical protein